MQGHNGLPPILLGDAGWTGTLAAVRALGREGIPVVLMDAKRVTHSRFSRHTAEYVRCPPVTDPGFIDWLLEFGRQNPGHVLYPTSDSLTYLYALHEPRLRRHFQMSLPPFGSVATVLDKKRLYGAAQRAGLNTPETHFPESEEHARELTAGLTFPLLLKPRTQVLSHGLGKGAIVPSHDRIAAEYRAFTAGYTYGHAVARHSPNATLPMVQEYHPDAAERIYILSGYVDDRHDLFTARASVKVLQWPRRLGIGLCFERAEVDAELAAGVRRMCALVNYRGLFQIEFIRSSSGRHLLIDFNPRFYHPLAFDVARGLPLPLMVYAASRGDIAGLGALVRAAEREEPQCTSFCNGFGFKVMLSAQRLSGRMPSDQAQEWSRWYGRHVERGVDSVADAEDPMPYLAYAADQLYHYARHPRSFVRTIVLNR